MKYDDPKDVDVDELPEIAVQKKGGFSIVWIIPIVAALVGGWLAYKTISEKGPTITITFEDGAGLEPGKTQVKYKSIDIGVVKKVDIIPDLSGVVVTAELGRPSEGHLTENTQFWVVRPRIGLGGISGLETLVSGDYIAIDPRPGTSSTTTFIGLEKPPGVTRDEEGAKFQLRAENLGPSTPGAPILFHDIEVGRILDTKLQEDGTGVVIDIFIEAPHHLRVRDTSRFWHISGFEISMGAEGLDVKVNSLASLLSGGIAFDTPDIAGGSSEPSNPGTVFKVFKTFASIKEEKYVFKRLVLVYFDGSVRGLSVGAPVEFQGIKIGSVVDIAVKFDPDNQEIQIPVLLELQADRLASKKKIQEMEQKTPPYSVLKKFVERGMRAQLQTGSLLTGQLFVEFAFHPNLPRKSLIMTGKYPEIPAVPATMDQFRRTVTDLMAEIRKMPLDKIAQEILETVEGANHLVNSPEAQEAIHSLNAALGNVEKLTEGLDQRVKRLHLSVEKTLAKARSALELADPDSPAAVNLNSALEELAMAARSIRVLTDYLEQHPESLVHGKGKGR
jgi:paraquat-inducible protein B